MAALDSLRQSQLDAVLKAEKLHGRMPIFNEPRTGKALALDTPLPTPSGWTTMGAVEVGDELLDETGSVCTVTFVTPIQLQRDCYSLKFSDGTKIVADAEHLWSVEEHQSSRLRGHNPRDSRGLSYTHFKCEILETQEMVARVREGKKARYRVAVAQPLKTATAKLIVDPYLLGAWLGDGSSKDGSVCCGVDDTEIIESIKLTDGITARKDPIMYGVVGLGPRLRTLNLLNNKHIPDAYKRAGFEQRLAVLQGLMDTDGTISNRQNSCEFSVKNEQLARDFKELLTSLGIPSTLTTDSAWLYNKPCGERHRVRFCPPFDIPVFRLKRKLARQRVQSDRVKVKNAYHRIISIEPVESVPVKCITVDSPSSLFLAGAGMIPTHNTRTALAYIERQKCQRVLVVVLNQFLPAWERELMLVGFDALPQVYLTDGPVVKRAEKLKAIVKAKQPAIVFVNYDAWWRDNLRAQIREWKPDLIVYDEAHRLIARGNHSARFASQIANREGWMESCLPMTATWQERGYEDIFGIYKACDPNVFGKDFLEFRARYCILASAKCLGCGRVLGEDNFLPFCGEGKHKGPLIPWDKYGQIIGYKNLDELFAKIHATSYFLTQDELHIPKPEVTVIPVELSPAARKLYDKFMKDLTTELEHTTLTVDRAIAALTKAQEITSGFAVADNGEVIYTSHEKLDASIDIARNETHHGYQHALYSKFLPDIGRLADTLKIPREMTYSGFAGEGEAGRVQRKQILDSLQNGNLEYLIGNVDMVSLGLDLSACRSATYMATGLSRIDFYQTNCRLQAVGRYPENFVLQAKHTKDENIFQMLMSKGDRASKVFAGHEALAILEQEAVQDAFDIFIAGG